MQVGRVGAMRCERYRQKAAAVATIQLCTSFLRGRLFPKSKAILFWMKPILDSVVAGFGGVGHSANSSGFGEVTVTTWNHRVHESCRVTHAERSVALRQEFGM